MNDITYEIYHNDKKIHERLTEFEIDQKNNALIPIALVRKSVARALKLINGDTERQKEQVNLALKFNAHITDESLKELIGATNDLCQLSLYIEPELMDCSE